MNKQSKRNEIIVFGTGSLADKWVTDIKKAGTIVRCIDNATEKQGQLWQGITVESPGLLKDTAYDRLYIASCFQDKILAQLARMDLLDKRVWLVEENDGPDSESKLPQLLDLPYFDTDIICQYLSGKKASNRFLALREARYRVAEVQTLPSELVIDPINYCNLSCPLCPTGRKAMGIAKGQIAIKDYERIMDELGETLSLAWMQNWGEPTLHKNLGQLIKIADDNHVLTYLASNLNLLNANVENAILNSGLKYLKVEVDGATEESYQRFRKGGKLRNVLDNLRRIAELKRSTKSKYPIISASCLVSSYNEYELEKLKALAIENGAERVEFYRISLDSRRKELVKEWSPQNKDFALDINDPSDRYFCSDPWKMISVNFNGAVQPCCRIFDDRVSYGNLFSSSIQKIWNNELFYSSRQILTSGGKKTGSKKTICHLCMGNLNSDKLEQVDGTLAIRLPDEVANNYIHKSDK